MLYWIEPSNNPYLYISIFNQKFRLKSGSKNIAQFRFPRSHRLKSRKAIAHLFEQNDDVFSYPIKLIYSPSPFDKDPTVPIKIAVTVPKRSFKSAVDRNLIKRRIRESYRLVASEIFMSLGQLDKEQNTALLAMFIYVGKSIEPFKTIEKGVTKSLLKMVEKMKVGNE